jgi:SAM-dependent methyltransferase
MRHPDPERSLPDWWKLAFDELYPSLYARRSAEEASSAIRQFCPYLPGLLSPGSLSIDVGCGQGRYLEALRDVGASAVGLDYSHPLLKLARSRLPEGRLVRGDMRRLPFRSESAATALSMFTSFGYFETDAENGSVLREMARVLGRGGRVLIDYLNPARVGATLVPFSSRLLGDSTIEERRWISPVGEFLCKETRVLSSGKAPRIYLERVRIYPVARITGFLESEGLGPVASFGSYAADPYDAATSPRWILVAEKGRVAS